MKRLLLLPFLLSLFVSNAQTTAIPDSNFEQALINLGYDSGPIDGVVLTANINGVTNLTVVNKNISDLTGIEGFSNLNNLTCMVNPITILDLSQNIALTNLNCQSNQLTTLNVSQNFSLSVINCSDNQLVTIDVSQNLSLTSLNCRYNQITDLDVTQNSALTVLQCSENMLSCLNVNNNNNTNMQTFWAYFNPALTCIQVDDTIYSNANWPFSGTNFAFDSTSFFSENCGLCTVGIEKLISSTVIIHPNPTTGYITINLEEASTGVLSIRNYLGQLVMKEEFNNTQELDIKLDAPAGIYFLQVESNGQIITKKIIKE